MSTIIRPRRPCSTVSHLRKLRFSTIPPPTRWMSDISPARIAHRTQSSQRWNRPASSHPISAAAPSYPFHTTARLTKTRPPSTPPPTDFNALNVLGNTPVPATSIDVCTPSGFHLNSGARTTDGSGVLLVAGEAFLWRPWLLSSPSTPPKSATNVPMRLLDSKGLWHIDPASIALLQKLWPRPDLLILGVGPEIRMLSRETRRAIAELGTRLEVLDTRNAAAQFNLLATERGTDDVAAALIPVGWKEGVGAGTGEEEGEFSALG